MHEVRLAFALLVVLGCNRASSTSVADAQAATGFVVDAATVPSCTIAYSCGLSHPGLGSSSHTTSIDFATCERTSATESGPFRSDVPIARGDASARVSTKSTTHLASADCARVRDVLTSVTPTDARAAQESAQMDTEACGLTL